MRPSSVSVPLSSGPSNFDSAGSHLPGSATAVKKTISRQGISTAPSAIGLRNLFECIASVSRWHSIRSRDWPCNRWAGWCRCRGIGYPPSYQ